MAPFDRVVLSYNDDPRYAEFVPLVVHAWRRFFPELQGVHAIRVTESKAPTGNAAKLERYYAAGEYNDVCLIHDIDTVPLQRNYYIDLTRQRQPNRLMCVGGEVYKNTEHQGKFPAGCITGEGWLFRRLFNEPIECYKGLRIFDHKEDPFNAPDRFSDESLIRALLSRAAIAVQHVKRAVDIHRDWIDRSWWHLFDPARLARGAYVECNMLRPWSQNREAMQPIVDYLQYEGPIP